MSLYAAIEDRLIDNLTPQQVRYLTPLLPHQTEGRLAEIYQQIRRDFQVVPPLTLHSQEPDLLAAVWAMVRESQIVVGRISRADKEALCSAVSDANHCPYCVDAHLGMLTASGAGKSSALLFDGAIDELSDPRVRSLVAWASVTRQPGARLLSEPPFTPEEAPEIIGTALVFHYVNRMASLFLSASPLPFSVDTRWFRRLGHRMFGVMARGMAAKRTAAGEAIPFLPSAELPALFSWARPSTHISAAFAGSAAVVAQLGERIPEVVRRALSERLSDWEGESPPLVDPALDRLLDALPEPHRPTARLAYLAALAPHRVDAKVIEAVREQGGSDSDLLITAAWASFAAMSRISSWIAPEK